MTYITDYYDDLTGIHVGVNEYAVTSGSQREAINDFMLTLSGVPTQKEMCEWVENYEEFLVLLNAMKEVDDEIKKHCRFVKKSLNGVPPHDKMKLEMEPFFNRLDVIVNWDIPSFTRVLRLEFKEE